MGESPNRAVSKESVRIEATIEEFISGFGTIESSTPGRIRFRVRREFRSPDQLDMVRERLATQPGIEDVSSNHRTGSVLVLYDTEIHTGHAVLEVLRDLAIVSEGFVGVEGEEEVLEGDSGESGGPGQSIANAIYDFDVLVYERTGLRRRGYLVPAAIAGLGVAQIAVYGIALESLSGPLLLYVAWDVYKHLKNEPSLPSNQEVEDTTIAVVNATVVPETT